MKRSRQEYKRKWITSRRALGDQHNDSSSEEEYSTTQQHALNRQTKTLPEETNLFVQEPSSSHAEFQINEDNQDNSSSDRHIDKDITSEEDKDVWNTVDVPVCISSESESEDQDCLLPEYLASWANEFKIKHNALDGLLKLLKSSGHSSLPSSSRTLLKTRRDVVVNHKSNMEYIYFGMYEALEKNFMKYPIERRENLDRLEISLNIDGVPLFKSTTTTLWPILCGIMNINPPKIFPVALTCGSSKPSNLDFLQDTITDLDQILNNGYVYNNKTINVILRCIVCDAPAKALVKSMKLYSGYYGCDKCDQRGEWHGRMTYQNINNISLRTDLSFRNQTNEEHHHALSPFCNLPIDMILHFPIDYMHQVCLGVMRRLLLIWMRGNKEVKMSAQQIIEISES
jgi:hypothetical protein